MSFSTRKHSLEKIVLEHPYLPITATSPQRPLSFVPKVAVVKRFDCIDNFLSRVPEVFCRRVKKQNRTWKKASAFAGYVHRSSRAFIFLSSQPRHMHDTKEDSLYFLYSLSSIVQRADIEIRPCVE